MMRIAIMALTLGGCASICREAPVPMHDHVRAELGQSCAETCAPWSCASAYGVVEQKGIACDAEAERFALCVCAPTE